MQTIIMLLMLAASPDAVTPVVGTETPTTTKPVKAKKICRAGSATGTRMTSKICKTQAEWDAQLGADATKLDNQRGTNSGY